jgi:hypothetical protein
MISKRSSILVVGALFAVASCGDDPVSPSPAINLSSGTVSFNAQAGGTSPNAQTVTITNTGGGTLSGLTATTTYGTGQPQGWLTASLNQTTAPATLTLTPTLGTLAAGTYNATVTVAAPNLTSRTVAVTFTVSAEPGHLFSYTPPTGAPTIIALAVPGEFNGWNPNAPEAQMTLVGGTWRLVVQLDPGTYEYKFNINGDWIQNMCNDPTWGLPPNGWVDVGATGCNEDPYGGANAYITID